MKKIRNLLMAIILVLAMVSINKLKTLESKFINEQISYSDFDDVEKVHIKSTYHIHYLMIMGLIYNIYHYIFVLFVVIKLQGHQWEFNARRNVK